MGLLPCLGEVGEVGDMGYWLLLAPSMRGGGGSSGDSDTLALVCTDMLLLLITGPFNEGAFERVNARVELVLRIRF
jgi:hypothetical protein